MSSHNSPCNDDMVVITHENLNDPIIKLKVGGISFSVRSAILSAHSRYFEPRISAGTIKEGSTTAFPDNDSELFRHIVRYMRAGIFPLFFDAEKGHDVFKYAKMLAEAKYFEVNGLVVWLEDKQYLKAANLTRGVKMLQPGPKLDAYLAKVQDGVTEVNMEKAWIREKSMLYLERANADQPVKSEDTKPKTTPAASTAEQSNMKELWMTVTTKTVEYNHEFCFEMRHQDRPLISP